MHNNNSPFHADFFPVQSAIFYDPCAQFLPVCVSSCEHAKAKKESRIQIVHCSGTNVVISLCSVVKLALDFTLMIMDMRIEDLTSAVSFGIEIIYLLRDRAFFKDVEKKSKGREMKLCPPNADFLLLLTGTNYNFAMPHC